MSSTIGSVDAECVRSADTLGGVMRYRIFSCHRASYKPYLLFYGYAYRLSERGHNPALENDASSDSDKRSRIVGKVHATKHRVQFRGGE